MGWVLALLITGLIAAGLLFTVLKLVLDSERERAELRWGPIGSVTIDHAQEWRLRFRILFIRHSLPLVKLRKKNRKKKKIREKGKAHPSLHLRRIGTKTARLLRAFYVESWWIALDTGDYTLNARLYPLNYMPRLRGHVDINFEGRDELHLILRTTAWKLLRAWLIK